MEGKRYKADLEAGNDAFAKLCAPMEKEIRKSRSWRPRKVFLLGNHEDRADRASLKDPKFLGHIGSENCRTRDWERYAFLERVWMDDICFSHYFQASHSNRPIGGSVDNRFNRIGCSFVQGHEQGYRIGNRIMGSGRTLYGLVAGSFYPHIEEYRGAQGQRHWRGIFVLNDVREGEYDIMPLSMNYLCRKYAGEDLMPYMMRKYPYGDWRHLGPAIQQRRAA
jgi:hypothetical protein